MIVTEGSAFVFDDWRSLAERAPDALCMTDGDGSAQWWNPAFERVIGAPSATGWRLWDVMFADHVEQVRALFGQVATGALPHATVPVWCSRHDGSTFHARWAFGAVTAGRVVGTVVDLGRPATGDPAAQEESRRLASMLSHVDETVLLTSADGTIRHAAGSGIDPGGAGWSGRNLFDVVHPDDIPRLGRRVGEVVDDADRQCRFDTSIRTTDDRWVPVMITVDNRLDEPSVDALVITLRNRTDHHRLQADLDQCRAENASIRRRHAAFVANASHELRDPLRAVATNAALLTHSGLPATTATLADTIVWQTGTLRRAVEDLLEFQQLGLGALRLTTGPVEVEHLVEQAVADASIHLLPGVTITTDTHSHTPATIHADQQRLTTSLYHLVSNAAKNTTYGTITVTASPAGHDRLRIEVTDTGHGISPGDLDRIFMPYERGHSHRPGGLGLGLPITRGIVEAMGGRLDVSSTPSLGSTFTIEIPTHPTADLSPTVDTPLRVLVVEDDPVNQMILAHQLGQLGATPTVADDAESALIRIQDEHFDLAIIDINLPGISGIEFARRYRHRTHTTYLAGTSTTSTAANRAACSEAGMNTVIPKPTTLHDIHHLLTATRHHVTRQDTAHRDTVRHNVARHHIADHP